MVPITRYSRTSNLQKRFFKVTYLIPCNLLKLSPCSISIFLQRCHFQNINDYSHLSGSYELIFKESKKWNPVWKKLKNFWSFSRFKRRYWMKKIFTEVYDPFHTNTTKFASFHAIFSFWKVYYFFNASSNSSLVDSSEFMSNPIVVSENK